VGALANGKVEGGPIVLARTPERTDHRATPAPERTEPLAEWRAVAADLKRSGSGGRPEG
jgi:hypothetical protein